LCGGDRQEKNEQEAQREESSKVAPARTCESPGAEKALKDKEADREQGCGGKKNLACREGVPKNEEIVEDGQVCCTQFGSGEAQRCRKEFGEAKEH